MKTAKGRHYGEKGDPLKPGFVSESAAAAGGAGGATKAKK